MHKQKKKSYNSLYNACLEKQPTEDFRHLGFVWLTRVLALKASSLDSRHAWYLFCSIYRCCSSLSVSFGSDKISSCVEAGACNKADFAWETFKTHN